jgi:hypothetical protein
VPSAENLKRRLLARIDDSALALTVHYAPARPSATPTGGTATAPLNPLTGAPPTHTLVQGAAPAPAAPPVTMPCLWLDVAAARNATLDEDRVRMNMLAGWAATATAQARVAVRDAALDPDAPWGGTVFDGAAYVEAQGRRYRVLGVEPIGASFADAYTYAVWLQGATLQVQRPGDAPS